MISADDIKALIGAKLPDAVVLLEDLTGGEDHWSAVVISDVFAELNRVKQHQRIYDALREPLKGPLHALQLRTLTRETALQEGLLKE
jgi:stress-induced morphogen